MKTTIISLTVLSLTLSAFMTNTTLLEKRKAILSSDQMGERVVAAFKKSSSAEYAALFPSSSDFTGMMKESSEIYGTYISAAQHEFVQNYKTKLVPAVRKAFEAAIKQGQEQGIDWSNVHYVGTEIEGQPSNRFSPVPVTIRFTSNGIEHKLIIEKVLVMNGNWNVSQYIKLN